MNPWLSPKRHPNYSIRVGTVRASEDSVVMVEIITHNGHSEINSIVAHYAYIGQMRCSLPMFVN